MMNSRHSPPSCDTVFNSILHPSIVRALKLWGPASPQTRSTPPTTLAAPLLEFTMSGCATRLRESVFRGSRHLTPESVLRGSQHLMRTFTLGVSGRSQPVVMVWEVRLHSSPADSSWGLESEHAGVSLRCSGALHRPSVSPDIV